MSYAKVLFIGYTLHTAPKSAVFQGEERALEAGAYPGLADPDQDLRARCALVKTALTAAYAALDKAVHDDRELLKLLVLPEFFFHGRGQAYPIDSRGSGLARLQYELAGMLRARKWQDWLCVFGSALFCRMDPSGPQVFNCGLVHRGGPDADPFRVVQIPLADALDLIPARLPIAKGDPQWVDSERPVWDQTGRIALAGLDLALELSTSHRHRAHRSQLAQPLPGARSAQLLIRPACAPLREPGSAAAALSILCNGLAQGECLLHSGSDTLRPRKTLALSASNHDIPALFAGRSAGRLSFFAPQALPRSQQATGFIAYFSHTTKLGHSLAFSFPYGPDGRLQRVEVLARLADGTAATSACLPCTLELRHPSRPLVARLALRTAPEDDQGRDLLVFAEIEGDTKGALHCFASRIPTAAPAAEAEQAQVNEPVTRTPAAQYAEPPQATTEAQLPDSPQAPIEAPIASPNPAGRAALVAAGPHRKVGHKTKEKPMSQIIEIEGIGPAIAGILEKHGVATVEELLKRAADPKGRTELAQQTGLPYKLVLRWCNMADLFRIKGVAEEYSDLLEAAGVDTVPELAQRNAANLHERMTELNERSKLVRRMPTAKQVAAWVEQAQQLPRLMTY